MGFSRQEYWSELPSPSSGDLPHPGIETWSLMSPTLASGFFTTSTTWEAPKVILDPMKMATIYLCSRIYSVLVFMLGV